MNDTQIADPSKMTYSEKKTLETVYVSIGAKISSIGRCRNVKINLAYKGEPLYKCVLRSAFVPKKFSLGYHILPFGAGMDLKDFQINAVSSRATMIFLSGVNFSIGEINDG